MTCLLDFLKKQFFAAIFGVFLLLLIVLSYAYYPVDYFVPRYDFMLLCALIFQISLIWLKFESLKEAGVILLFHMLAMCMEIFKVHVGSWIYPDSFVVGIAGVPLFAGFMYSAVGSYLVRVHRLFNISYEQLPATRALIGLALASYINFFTHHYIWDARWLITVLSIVYLWDARLYLQVNSPHFLSTHLGRGATQHKSYMTMPVLLPLLAVAVLIWLAENIATYSRVWLYPNQLNSWQMVSIAKITSWYLLLLLSYALVLVLLGFKGQHKNKTK